VINKEVRNDLGPKDLNNRSTTYMEYKNKSDTNSNRDNWTMSKSFRKYLNIMSGKHDTKALQKTAVLGTARILWKVLMGMYKVFVMEIELHIL
jgi:hypothetical protein